MLCSHVCGVAHLHVDLFKTGNEVTDFPKSEASHPGGSTDAHQEHPLLFSVLELLRSKVDLTDIKKKESSVWWINKQNPEMRLKAYNQPRRQ